MSMVKKNLSSNLKDEQMFDLKNELANVLDEMSNNQKKVDKQFTEVKQYVDESVKTILNELRSAGTKSNEFNEDRVCAIEQQWLGAKKDMRYISPEHYVGQYIRGFKMLANVSWDTVDNIIISVNVSKSFHGIMILFRIRHMCLYVYDLFIGGAVNTKNVLRHVQSLATIIPLFLFATDFYGKRADICWDREPAYINKSMIDPLKYVIVRDIPQQAPQSKKKKNNGAISESEVTGNVTSRLGGPKILRDFVSPAVTKKIRNR
ncbi:hypothetical protein FXO37_12051 [Capsicum annuum]|nr:hypothetical protein FXO37_12051 [Capsicum annuum]